MADDKKNIKRLAEEEAEDRKDEKVNVFVTSAQLGDLLFKVKLTTPFTKISTAFCTKKGLDPKTIRYLSSAGELVNTSQNLSEIMDTLGLELEDVDGVEAVRIDCVQQQIGGGR
ncbi:hypothetical protein FPQ18DRAFT_348043 [Pyronema domesticum]|nr:hypothetical protein FPQ18DRAFT_348043 [Pyronema domesticum]